MEFNYEQSIGETILNLLLGLFAVSWNSSPISLLFWSCFRHFVECSSGKCPNGSLMWHIIRYTLIIVLTFVRYLCWDSEYLSLGLLGDSQSKN